MKAMPRIEVESPQVTLVQSSEKVLRVEDLELSFRTRRGLVSVLRKVSFEVNAGETLALVGESGSGKSVTCLTVMGLLDDNASVDGGKIELLGSPLQLGSLTRGPALGLAMIFQYPRTALNPIRRVGWQIADVLATMGVSSQRERRREAVRLLEEVHISDPERRFDAYPFELSGGQCQRVLIAMALARRPRLLIADEPTTGLDVVTQRTIMELIEAAQRSRGMSTILVTHDLGLACEAADRVVVMQHGEVVESASSEQLFRDPKHPYTRALLAATPAVTPSLESLRAALGGQHD